MTAAAWESMKSDLNEALRLIEEYNRHYNTFFKATEPYTLTCTAGNVTCDFADKSWPCNHHAGVYLILSADREVIYVGQTLSFGYRFHQYFKNEDGTCVIRSPYWTKAPVAIVAVATPDERKYERLSLEEYLIKELQPVDNLRGKK